MEEVEIFKTCTKCNNTFIANYDFFYKQKEVADGLSSWCKTCKKAYQNFYFDLRRKPLGDARKIRHIINRDRENGQSSDWYKINKNKRKEYMSNWQKNNKDKIHSYVSKNKKHDISKEEIKQIYKYSNSCCMYCGISEIESKKIYNQKLHKDHAINNGDDTIKNCVLSCRSCNSTKNVKDWTEWYVPTNPLYCQRRFDRIYEWLNNQKAYVVQ